MKIVLSILGALITIAYPLLIYVGLSRGSLYITGLILAVAAVAGLFIRIKHRQRGDLATILSPPIATLVLVILSLILKDQRFMLAMPSLINLALLMTFGRTLFGGTPMVERFARLQKAELTEAQ